MRNETRIKYNAYTSKIAAMNGVPSAATKFSVTPAVEQTLEDRIQERADFLRQVNVVPVDDQSGQALGLGTSGPAAGRTDTATKDREPRNLVSMNGTSYTCTQTNFDTFVPYKQLDAWARFSDFQTRLRNRVIEQIARDRLMIGWNGVSSAADTDITVNPLLQDVNKGWLQHIRDSAPQRVMSAVKVGTDAGADYRNLDALVFDAANELLEPWYQDDPDIVAIMGRSLLTDKYLALLNGSDADKPTEKAALTTMLLNKAVGGKRAILVPFFPANSILITKASNLSIYWQNGTHRRQIEDQPKRDRIVDYASDNEAYVIEDLGACAFVDGILGFDPDADNGAGDWV